MTAVVCVLAALVVLIARSHERLSKRVDRLICGSEEHEQIRRYVASATVKREG